MHTTQDQPVRIDVTVNIELPPAVRCNVTQLLTAEVEPMRALSVRQPWAWFLANGYKDIENRTWPTKRRGRFLIHASQGMTRREYAEAVAFAVYCGVYINAIPSFDLLERGGIVGVANLVDCVTASDSPWFVGTHGFVVRDAKPLPFTRVTGALGFFKVPDAVRNALKE